MRSGSRISFDAVAASLLPDVNELSEEELDDFLDSDSDEVTRYYFESLATKIGEETRPSQRPRRRSRPRGLAPKTAQALAEYARSEIFSHFSGSGVDPSDAHAWAGTHIPARILREARLAGIADEHRAYILDGVFDALAETTCDYLTAPNAHVDTIWPLLESLEELGGEVSREPILASLFVARYVELATGHSATLTASLTWGVNELFERGPASQHLAGEVAAELVRLDRTDRSRSILHLIGRLRPRDQKRLPLHEMHDLDRAGKDFLRTLLEHVERSRRLFSASLRDDANRIDFTNALPSAFARLLYLARSTSAFTTVATTAAIKLALRGTYTPVARTAPRPRSAAVGHLCALVMDRVAGVHDGVVFPACEALEGMRDRFKAECASVMAALLPDARPLMRQALFVFMSEGYEESFRGRRQREVPKFVTAGGRIRFLPYGHRSEFSGFGRRAARLATIYPELRQNLEWMNERLEGWLLDANH